MNRNVLLSLAAVAAIAFAGQVAAQSTATGTGIASAGASSSSELSTGISLGAASVGAAYCANSVVIGPFGGSQTDDRCVALDALEQGGRFGTLSRGEIRAGQLAVLEESGYVFRAPAPETTAGTSSRSRPAAAETQSQPSVLQVTFANGQTERIGRGRPQVVASIWSNYSAGVAQSFRGQTITSVAIVQ